MLAPEATRLPKANATPFPRMLPRAERLVTALEKSRIIKATVDRIVCAHQDSQLTYLCPPQHARAAKARRGRWSVLIK